MTQQLASPPTSSRGQSAIVDALVEFNAQSRGLTPWMSAASLAQRVGATSPHDPQFEADVQALFEAGTIRLMSGGKPGGASFYSAMLVPPDTLPKAGAAANERF